MSRVLRTVVVIFVLTLLLITAARAELRLEEMNLETLGDCDDLARDHAGDWQAYRCFLVMGIRLQQLEEAARRLEALRAIGSGRHWATFYRALIAKRRKEDRTEGLLREALAGFRDEGEADGQVWALEHLAWVLRSGGRKEEGRAALAQALEIAEEAENPQRIADVKIEIASHDREDSDYRSALKNLKEAEAALFPDGWRPDQFRVLGALAALSWDVGRLADAWAYYRRQMDLLGDQSPAAAAGVLRNMALIAPQLRREGLVSSEEVRRLRTEAVETAVRSGNRWAEIGARMALAQEVRGPEGLEHARRAVAIARERRSPGLSEALVVLAKAIRAEGGSEEESYRLFDEAVAHARSRGDRWKTATALKARATARMADGPRERAIEESLETLRAIEDLRDLQVDREVRTRIFGRFAVAYRRVASWLMGEPGTVPPAEDLSLAFEVIERLHARELLDTLDAARGTGVHAPAGPRGEERAEVLSKIASLQRRLLSTSLAEDERERLLDELEQLELREADLRVQIAENHPGFAHLRRPRIPGIGEVQEILAGDEALIFFVAAASESDIPRTDRYGLYRAIVLTADSTAVVDLPEGRGVEAEVELFVTLLQRRDGSADEGASRLHDELIREAIAELPPGIGRLILVPDGVLHHVPFGALTEPESDEPLAARFQIAYAPSTTTLVRWRRAAAQQPARAVLALADPALAGREPPQRLRGAGAFGAPPRLGPLPHARDEARAMLQGLGGEGRLLVGAEATEEAFKKAELAEFKVLHLAAHALVDYEKPERSAVVLAAGSPDEDGLLQFREILDLDLHNQLVILSACRSGSGAVIGGEGVMGLASAFFQAGARTVVAGLWPLRDDETAALAAELGRHLGRGESVGSALARARQTLIRRGAPRAAWAGLVVLGDADLVLLPGGRPPDLSLVSAGIAALLAATGLGFAWLLRRRTRLPDRGAAPGT